MNDQSLFVIDSIFGKNEFSGMGHHEEFVYKLGLELSMSYITHNQNVADKYESKFLEDLHERNKCFKFPHRKCQICGFHTESMLVMDSHLAEPHPFSYATVACNYCPFKTKSKEKYLEHLLNAHKRTAKLEKPFIDKNLMCRVCDYETVINSFNPKLCDIEKTLYHINSLCPFQENNSDINPGLNIDYKHILNNNQSPSQFDLIDFEFLFNKKSNDVYVNKYNLFALSLLKSNSILATKAAQEDFFLVYQTKLLESLIHNKPLSNININVYNNNNNNNIQKENIQQNVTNTAQINQIPIRPLLTSDSSFVPKQTPHQNLFSLSKPIQTISYNNQTIRCDLCPISFTGTFALVNYETHLKLAHSIRKGQDLRDHLSKCFKPVEQKTQPQCIKVIKLNQNLILIRKNELNPILTPVVKRPIEVIELDNEDNSNSSNNVNANNISNNNNNNNNNNIKKIKVNENTDIFIQTKLKEIENEKKHIFSLLNVQKNDSDLIELKDIKGNCYICKLEFPNLLSHLNTEHQLNVCKSIQLNRCILCGDVFEQNENLIRHQYEKHCIFGFVTLNKVFTVEKEKTSVTQEFIVLDDDEKLIQTKTINLKVNPNSDKCKDKTVKKCVKCSEQFDSFRKLLDHVKNEHESLYNKSSKTFDFDQEQVNTETPVVKESDSGSSLTAGKKITCQFCSFDNLQTKGEYEQHLIKTHMKSCEVRLTKSSDVEEKVKIKMLELKNSMKMNTQNVSHNSTRRSSRFKK